MLYSWRNIGLSSCIGISIKCNDERITLIIWYIWHSPYSLSPVSSFSESGPWLCDFVSHPFHFSFLTPSSLLLHTAIGVDPPHYTVALRPTSGEHHPSHSGEAEGANTPHLLHKASQDRWETQAGNEFPQAPSQFPVVIPLLFTFTLYSSIPPFN